MLPNKDFLRSWKTLRLVSGRHCEEPHELLGDLRAGSRPIARDPKSRVTTTPYWRDIACNYCEPTAFLMRSSTALKLNEPGD
jgi:hypothetical protein